MMIYDNRQINICPNYFVTDKINIVMFENRRSRSKTVHKKVKTYGLS